MAVVDAEEIEGVDRNSLAARAQRRREDLLNRQTTVLEVPGYEGVLAVEYRALSYAEIRRISRRNERVSDESTRELYVGADTLMAASVNSYELLEDGNRKELEMGWGVTLARALGVEIPDTMTARQALFACFPRDMLMTAHVLEYGEWLSSAEGDVDEEQRRDFPATK